MLQNMRSHWSGKIGFILASAAGAIGLGNLWKFPYITYLNGGGIFVLIYLVCILLLGVPIMFSEIIIGKYSQSSPANSFQILEKNKKSIFRWLGLLTIISSFVIMSYYSIVSGWAIEYVVKAVKGDFTSMANDTYITMLADPKTSSKLQQMAFLEDITFIDDATKKQILLDSALVDSTSKGLALSTKFQEMLEIIPDKLEEQGLLNKWQKFFYEKKQSTGDFEMWARDKLMPIHSSNSFTDFVSSPLRMVIWQLCILFGLLIILTLGVNRGIEKSALILMPFLIVLIIILAFNSLSIDKEFLGLKFLLKGDISKFTYKSILEALGHSFFTLSLGMGVMITYGSYLNKKNTHSANAISSGSWIIFMDTFIALLACCIIFPILFVYNFEPSNGGIGILFTAIPLELAKFSYGYFFTILFYVLILFAAFTSAISLVEPTISTLCEKWKLGRLKATILTLLTIFACSIPSLFSLSFLGVADGLASNLLLPMGALATALFMGYRYDLTLLKPEFAIYKSLAGPAFYTFVFLIRYVTPILISLVFIYSFYTFIISFL